ncbi:uncharacterized protein LOC6507454 [Drosophila ananassae]|uniref:uncharacterized protein LOC6507454 n=1 Tax=Drosophila ananassae TaxID=7217 RepID=UPI0013A5DD9A|nr:uncharacterized protein LOC6507454 [Drosophila ananassae]
MNSLRLLVLLGLLLATQGRSLDQEPAAVQGITSQEVLPAQGTGVQTESPKTEEGKLEVQKTPAEPSDSVKPEENKEVPAIEHLSVENPSVSNEISKSEEPSKAEEAPRTEEEIPKQKEPKEQNPAEVQGRDNFQAIDHTGSNQIVGAADLDKIFKYPVNLNQSLSSYQGLYNKFGAYPEVEVITITNATAANVTHHVHDHYYNNQKKPGFPFPFLPNPFEKQETTYVNLTETTTGNVTHHTHIHEETKPFPFLPNPFTDFPKVVGLSLVLLPNPFYVDKSQGESSGSGNKEGVQYQYYGKFRGFSEASPQKQEQPQKPGFYLIPNPLAQQANEGRLNKADANVLLPVNLAALPLLVPAPEFSQGKASSVNIQDVIKATNGHVSDALKVPANGLSQLQKEQAAVQQFLLSHLSQQQKLFEKNLLNEKRSQSAPAGGAAVLEEESTVLFAVEIPKPIYRFFKGIFGGFSQ